MPPVGQKRRSGRGAASDREQPRAANRLGGKELQRAEPELPQRHGLRRGRAARQEWHGRLRRGPGERRGSAGADQKSRSRRHRLADLIDRNDRACANDRAGHAFGDLSNRRKRRRRTQRHFDRVKTPGDQRLRLRDAILDARHRQDRDNRGERHDRSRFAVEGIKRHRALRECDVSALSTPRRRGRFSRQNRLGSSE